jgi:conjugative transfer signal peptidase TraF
MSSLSALATLGLPAVALGLLAASATQMPKLVVLNESPSLPRGLYVRAMDQVPSRGAIVAVAPPDGAQAYLAGLGMPAGVPLLKRVAAVGGDVACAAGGAVALRDRTLPVQSHDRLGAALPVWRSCERLPANEVFVVGDTANSFDSRYFGPVSRQRVEGVFKELVTW